MNFYCTKVLIDFNILIDLRSRLKLRLHVISLSPATLGDVLWHRDFGTDALCVSIRYSSGVKMFPRKIAALT